MFCKNCGNQLKDGAKFCAKCGTPVAQTTTGAAGKAEGTQVTPQMQAAPKMQPTPQPQVMPKMQTAPQPQVVPQPQQAPQMQPAEAPKKKSGAWKVIVPVAAVAFLAAAGTAAYMLALREDAPLRAWYEARLEQEADRDAEKKSDDDGEKTSIADIIGGENSTTAETVPATTAAETTAVATETSDGYKEHENEFLEDSYTFTEVETISNDDLYYLYTECGESYAIDEYISAYYDQNGVYAIIVTDIDGYGAWFTYFYDDNELCSFLVESVSESRFYVYNSTYDRWEGYIMSEGDGTDFYTLSSKEDFIQEARLLGYKYAAIPEEIRLSYEYVIPDSSSRQLVAADIENLTKEELRLARNEIYARHGRIFGSEDLSEYFNSKSWYNGTVPANAFSEEFLSQIERDNVNLIKEREAQLP